MSLNNFLEDILFSADLGAKLNSDVIYKKNFIDDLSNIKQSKTLKPFNRSDKLKWTSKQIKFPRLKALLSNIDQQAFAISSFANHELQAIELMAYAIYYLPHHDEFDVNYKLGLLKALKDEQKHFKLYQQIINNSGFEFGDFPINDFFLKQIKEIENIQEFAAMMNLTFEAANLDFASYYQDIFANNGNHEIADCLKTVLIDEISHVALGPLAFRKNRHITLWDQYRENLVSPLTPARSKGINYKRELRVKAHLSEDFLDGLDNYSDNFTITKRKNRDTEIINGSNKIN